MPHFDYVAKHLNCERSHREFSFYAFFKMNLRERSIIFVTFLIACWALALTAGGLGTKYWVVSNAVRLDSGLRELNKSNGYIHFGLFEGTWRLDSGVGERVHHKKILELTYLDPTFLVKGLYNATIGCVTASLFFGVVSALLAVVNTASNPTEPICHLPGKIQFNLKNFFRFIYIYIYIYRKSFIRFILTPL